MVQVTLSEHNDYIIIEIKGHCSSGDENTSEMSHRKICSCVTLIACTIKAICDNKKDLCNLSSGYLYCEYKKAVDVSVEVLGIEALILELYILQKYYPNHIKIEMR